MSYNGESGCFTLDIRVTRFLSRSQTTRRSISRPNSPESEEGAMKIISDLDNLFPVIVTLAILP